MDLTADLPTSCFSNSDYLILVVEIMYMINRQSHAFECNLGIIAITYTYYYGLSAVHHYTSGPNMVVTLYTRVFRQDRFLTCHTL